MAHFLYSQFALSLFIQRCRHALLPIFAQLGLFTFVLLLKKKKEKIFKKFSIAIATNGQTTSHQPTNQLPKPLVERQ